jgi:hypothetical protein
MKLSSSVFWIIKESTLCYARAFFRRKSDMLAQCSTFKRANTKQHVSVCQCILEPTCHFDVFSDIREDRQRGQRSNSIDIGRVTGRNQT